MDSMQRSHRVLALLLSAAFAVGPAFAKGGHGHDDDHGHKHDKHHHKHHKHDKHEHKHGHKNGRHDAQDDRRGGRPGPKHGAYFDDRNRDVVHRYYASHPGKPCPPGLARKHNGCMPPGQARQVWLVGQPLPRTVVVAPVPQQIVVSLPPPPSGHKYVQVAGDVLLVAVGSMMVVDGINGLMNR
jgi:Ni/Co efflux regulator RcnB